MDKHFIVLNGKRYDAVTGALLGSDETAIARPGRQHRQTAKTVHAPRAVPSQRQTVTHTPTTEAHKAHTVKPKPADRSHHGKPKHVAAHKPQTTKTLMRRAVIKPTKETHPAVKQQYPVIKTKSGVTVQAPKRLAHAVDESRVQRSAQTPKSTHVGRFQAAALAPVKPHVIPITVVEPKSAAATGHDAKKQTAHRPAKKIDIFEHAIATAKSHEQKSPKRFSTRKKIVSASAGLAAVLVIGGFITALNQSSIQMQLASARAGFQATEPQYAPEGFERQGASVAGKAVAIKYASPKAVYTLTQESSGWNSQTLFDNITASYGNDYEVVYSSGRIIYIYNGADAAWVDGGILYKISGNSALTKDQITSIADSI